MGCDRGVKRGGIHVDIHTDIHADIHAVSARYAGEQGMHADDAGPVVAAVVLHARSPHHERLPAARRPRGAEERKAAIGASRRGRARDADGGAARRHQGREVAEGLRDGGGRHGWNITGI